MTPVQLKTRAHNAVQSAIESGDLVRPPLCGECGRPPSWLNVIEAHHDDYAKPLAVRWLCKSCHQLLHSNLRKAQTVAPKLSPKAARLLAANHCLVQS